MIYNIQFLRAFAAVSVAIYHTSYALVGHHTDFQGVAIFFVISGFIMCHIVLRNEQEANSWQFMLHRIVRIVPLYWICVTILIVLSNLGLLNLPVTLPYLWKTLTNDPLGLVEWAARGFFPTWVSIDEVVKTLLFIPYLNVNGNPHPLLGVGWTLNLEMLFYVCFAVALFYKKKCAPLLTAVIVISIFALVPRFFGEMALGKLYGSFYMLHFVVGIAVYYLWIVFRRVTAEGQKLRSITILTSIVLLVGYLIPQLIPNAQAIPLLPLACPGMVVLAALLLESSGFRISHPWFMLLGAASYSLYLTHTIVLEILRPIGERIEILNFKSSGYGFLVSFVLMIGIGIIVHSYIEKPCLRLIRNRLKWQLT